mmetsp:Transcript_12415/g.25631  ORF Transcript_12415/g.25631 Transcript_12415/m.25631 type:complete len:102 (+) Transcript_12415:363-668(+)
MEFNLQIVDIVLFRDFRRASTMLCNDSSKGQELDGVIPAIPFRGTFTYVWISRPFEVRRFEKSQKECGGYSDRPFCSKAKAEPSKHPHITNRKKQRGGRTK